MKRAGAAPAGKSARRVPEAIIATLGRAGLLSRGRSILHRFWRERQGAVALEAALAMVVVVGTLAALFEFVQVAYTRDTLSRAARAAANEVSLMAEPATSESALESVVCRAIRRELNLAEDVVCSEQWDIRVESYADAKALLEGTASPASDSEGGEHGEMVLVRLAQEHTSLLLGALTRTANAQESGDGGECEEGEGGSVSGTSSIVVTAIARNEREVTL